MVTAATNLGLGSDNVPTDVVLYLLNYLGLDDVLRLLSVRGYLFHFDLSEPGTIDMLVPS